MKSTAREHNRLYYPKGDKNDTVLRPLKQKERAAVTRQKERAERIVRDANGRALTGGELFALANLRRFKELLGEHGERFATPLQTRPLKKVAFETAVPIVRNAVLAARDAGRKQVSLEYIVEKTRLHPKLIDKAFMVLNREGLLGQAENQKHHDFEWVATSYPIRSQA